MSAGGGKKASVQRLRKERLRSTSNWRKSTCFNTGAGEGQKSVPAHFGKKCADIIAYSRREKKNHADPSTTEERGGRKILPTSEKGHSNSAAVPSFLEEKVFLHRFWESGFRLLNQEKEIA